MVINDTLMTVFAASGAGLVLNYCSQMATAQEKLAKAQMKAALTNPLTHPGEFVSAASAVKTAQMGLARSWVAGAGMVAGAVGVYAMAMKQMIDEYAKFSREVMTIKSLTGASSKDSVKAVLMGQVAGMSDTTEIREILRSGSAMFSSGGQGALAKLGIAANPNQSGLAVLNQIMDRLQDMPDSLRKTQIMEQIFGARGVAAMQPLLRLTKEQRGEIDNLSAAYDTGGLAAIQQYSAESALLGASFQQNIIFPIAQAIIPALTEMTQWISGLIGFFGWLNKASGNFLAGFAGWAGAAMAIVGVVSAINMLVNAFKLLIASETIAALMAGDFSAIGRLTLGIGAVAGVIGGIDAMANSGQTKPEDTAANKMNKAADKMETTVNKMADAFDSLKGKGVPGGLSTVDIQSFYRAGAIGAIG